MARKVRKNESCPCGSGKKYQHCCGALENVIPFRRKDDFEQAWELWALLNEFAESGEFDAQREEAWFFFQRECLCGLEPTAESMQSFLDWFILDFDIGQGENILERFVKKNRRRLLPEQLAVLKRWSVAAISLYRVQEVRAGRGLLVEDVLRGGTVEILNKGISTGIKPGFLLITRLIPVGDSYDYSGALFIIPPLYEKELKKELAGEIRIWSKRKRAAPFGDPLWAAFLHRRGHLLLSFLNELYLTSLPGLGNDTPERKESKSLLAVAVFHLQDTGEAIRRMRQAPFLRLVQEKKSLRDCTYTWEWLDTSVQPEKYAGNLLLLEDRLLLHSFNQQDLPRGKRAITSLLNGLITFDEVNYFEMLPQNIQPEPALADKGEDLQEDFLHYYWRTWIHSALPGFQGKTPFQIRKGKDGKSILEKVIGKMTEKRDNQGEVPAGMDLDLVREKLLLNGDVPWRADDWNWEAPVYREIACCLEEIAEPMELTPQQLANGLRLWHDFLVREKPVIRKPQAWAGALAYLISSLDLEGFSQKEIAGFFDITGGAISAISLRIKQSLDLEEKAGLYSTRG